MASFTFTFPAAAAGLPVTVTNRAGETVATGTLGTANPDYVIYATDLTWGDSYEATAQAAGSNTYYRTNGERANIASFVSYFNPDTATLDLTTGLGGWHSLTAWNALADTRITAQPTWLGVGDIITPPPGVYLIHLYAAFQFTTSSDDIVGDFTIKAGVSVNDGAADPAYNFYPQSFAHIDTTSAANQLIVLGTSFVQPIQSDDTVGLDYRVDAVGSFTPVSGQSLSVGGTGVQLGFTRLNS